MAIPSTMPLIPLLLILLSTALSISYKLSRRCRLSRSTRRSITAAHAFFMESVQIILLAGSLISTPLSFSGAGQQVLANSDPANRHWPALLLTIITCIAAIFTIDIIDNKIQLGSFRHPIQIQTFLLTRSKLFPCTTQRPRKRVVISELEADTPQKHIVEKDATPVTPIRQTSSSRSVSITPEPGRVARLVSAFEEDLCRAASPPRPSPSSQPKMSNGGSNSQEEEEITCSYGCDQHFASWYEESLHCGELHSSWFCAICTPNSKTATAHGPTYRTPAAVSRHLRIAHGINWSFPEQSSHAYAFFDVQTPKKETLNKNIDEGMKEVKTPPGKQTETTAEEIQKSQKSNSSGGSIVLVTPPTPMNTPALQAQHSDTISELLAPFLESPSGSAAQDLAIVPFRTAPLLSPPPPSSKVKELSLSVRPSNALLWPSPPWRSRQNAFVPEASRHTAERLKQRSMRRGGEIEETVDRLMQKVLEQSKKS